MLWLTDGYKRFPASALRPDMGFCEYCDKITPREKMLDEFFCSKKCQDKKFGLYEEEKISNTENIQYTDKSFSDVLIGDKCMVSYDLMKSVTPAGKLIEGQELTIIGDYTIIGEGSGIRLKDKSNNEYRLLMPAGKLIKVINSKGSSD